jgi:hypothetical protein
MLLCSEIVVVLLDNMIAFIGDSAVILNMVPLTLSLTGDPRLYIEAGRTMDRTEGFIISYASKEVRCSISGLYETALAVLVVYKLLFSLTL